MLHLNQLLNSDIPEVGVGNEIFSLIGPCMGNFVCSFLSVAANSLILV